MAREQPDHCRLKLPNQHLHDPQQWTSADGETVFELRVVEVFDPNSGEAPDHVGRFEQIAQVDWIDMPRTMLLAGRRHQGRRRSAVSTARVEVDQIDLRLCVIRRFGTIGCHEIIPCGIGSETAMFCCEKFHRTICSAPSCSSTSAVWLCTQSPSFTYKMFPIARCSDR